MDAFCRQLATVVDGCWALCRLWDEMPPADQIKLCKAYPTRLFDFDEVVSLLADWHARLREGD
jgi:hypothetical protein